MRPRRSRRTLNLIGALAVLAALVLAYGWATDFGRRTPPPTAYGHLEQFQTLAEEHGDRAMGTSGYEAAAQYVEQQLDNAGYESSRQYFTVQDRGQEIETFNIIAETETETETETGSEDSVVMLGAHLDGVPDIPAINDNASGAAALLVAATELGQQDESTNKARLAWWGAEELPATPGSRHYVQNLAQNDSAALENIAVYLNFDMVASPNPVIAVYDAGETDVAEDPHHGHRSLDVPDGSVEVMEVFTGYFQARDQPWVTTEWNFVSDQVPFIEEGVAVGGLFTGSGEGKTDRQASLFGGTAGQPRDPNYHTSGDDLGNVNQEALTIMTDAITHAATTLAQDSSALE